MTFPPGLAESGALLLGAVFLLAGCALKIRQGPAYRRKPKAPPSGPKKRTTLEGEVARLREENLRLADRVERLADVHAALAPLFVELDCTFDPRNVGSLVLRVLDRVFSPPRVLVVVPDRDATRLTIVGARGLGSVKEGDHQAFDEGIAGRAAVAHRPVSVRLDAARTAAGRRPSLEHAMPILNRRELYGVIAIGGCDLGPSDIRLLALVANLTAVALANHLQYRRIQRLANSDPMTGIFNKAYFLGHSHVRLALARHTERPMSLLMIDVDDFKAMNDRFGHVAGDRLLKEIVRVIGDELRDADLLARFGGEEFVVLLDGVGKEEAGRVAERIRRRVATHAFPGREQQPLGLVSISVGVATLGEDASELEPLVVAADQAMYRAKQAGRNQVALSSRASPLSAGTPPEAATSQPLRRK